MHRKSNDTRERQSAEMNVCLYRKAYAGRQLRLVSMDCNLHITFMHRWANQWYATRYWQMQSDYESFQEYYVHKMKSRTEMVLIVYVDDQPVAQIEIYQAGDNEIAQHTTTEKDDYGFHLLMAPYRETLKFLGDNTKGLSGQVIRCVLEYLFYHCAAGNVFAEPDKNNLPACQLAESSGFIYLKEIKMSYKDARLYKYSRNDFLLQYPAPRQAAHLGLFADKRPG